MNIEMLVELIHQTDEKLQRRAAVAVDRSLVIRNWLVGLYLVEFEQHGEDKAEYGEMLMAKAATRLAVRQRKGFSETNLKLFRQFYRAYSGIHQGLSGELLRQIPQTLHVELQPVDDKSVTIRQTLSDELAGMLPLSWSHYAFLVQVENVEERRFYEIEAAQQKWSLRELKRQFNTSLYERLALSRDKRKIQQLSRDGQILATPSDIIKSPLVLEFLGLEDQASYSESDLEAAIISRLEHFLLELGKGFLFQSRQFRLTFDDKHFWVDLVFYNRLLRCFVVVDLKIGELTHQDIGQMQMYVNFFDRKVKTDEESPTIGILLCRSKSDAVVEMTLPADNHAIFASRYQLYLPSKDELRAQLKAFEQE
ncbi:MAG: PDDEXK nuclease domain-containing protein [bacterium]